MPRHIKTYEQEAVTNRTLREKESKEIQTDIEEFLKRGGAIDVLCESECKSAEESGWEI